MSRTSKYLYVEKHGFEAQVVASDGLRSSRECIGINVTLPGGHVGVSMSAAAGLTLAADHWESESADQREVA